MTESEDKKEAVISAEQAKQLREMMIAQGAPKIFIDSIPDEKMNDPEFIKRAVMKAQGLPIPTEGTYTPKEKKEQEEGEVNPLAGLDISMIMEMIGPMVEKFEEKFTELIGKIEKQKAGNALLWDQVVHLKQDVHLMAGGCLLEQAKTNPKFGEPGKK